MDKNKDFLLALDSEFMLPEQIIKEKNICMEDFLYGKSVEETEYKIQCLIYDLAEYFWMTRSMEGILKYSRILGAETIFEILAKLSAKWEETRNKVGKDLILAEGFLELSNYDMARRILEDSLLINDLGEDDELQVRGKLDEIYDLFDEKIRNKYITNKRRIIELNGYLKKDCLVFLREFRYSNDSEDEDFIVEVVKRYNDREIWHELMNNIYLKKEFFAKIYEEARPSSVLEEDTYLRVLEYWLDKKQYNKINRELENIRRKLGCSKKLGYFEIEKLLDEGKYDKADEIALQLLNKDKEDRKILLLKIKIMVLQKKYNEVLEWIGKHSQLEGTQEILYYKVISLIKLEKISEAIEYFVQSYNTGKVDNYFIYFYAGHSILSESIMIEVLDGIESHFDTGKLYGMWEAFVPHVLYLTEGYKKKGELRYKIFRMYAYANAIKEILQISTEDVGEVYHYSKEESLKYLPKYNNEIGGKKLRLGNVAYLNDPEEGEIFYKILKESGCSGIKHLQECKELEYDNTYLVCFSRKEDFLPMWVQYAHDGTGNCYAIDTTCFDSDIYEIEDNYLYCNVIQSRFKQPNHRYILYKVFYYGGVQNEEYDRIIGLCKKIGQIVDEMAVFFQDAKIKGLVNSIISSVQYLFKDVAYSNEEEVRIICTDYNNKKLVDINRESVPRFYMELEKEIYFNKIILGPKAKSVREKVTYLSCCENVEKVEISKIKYV